MRTQQLRLPLSASRPLRRLTQSLLSFDPSLHPSRRMPPTGLTTHRPFGTSTFAAHLTTMPAAPDLAPATTPTDTIGPHFLTFLASLPQALATKLHILTDSDADGLPAAAILVRALRLAGYTAVTAEVRLKIKHMELSIIRRETTGAAPNQYNESETLVRFEVCGILLPFSVP